MKFPFFHKNESTTTIVLARHGAVHLKDGKPVYYQKLPGYPLSERGIRSAEQLALSLEKENIKPTVWYYSPRTRTEQTAKILQIYLNTPYIYPDPRIDEIDYPGLAGRPYTGQLPSKNERDPGYRWELPVEVGQRISDFMRMLIERHETQIIGVVSHEAVISVMALWQLGLDLTGADTVDELREKVRKKPEARRIPKKFLEDGLDPGQAYITKVEPNGLILEGRIISPNSFYNPEGKFFSIGRIR